VSASTWHRTRDAVGCWSIELGPPPDGELRTVTDTALGAARIAADAFTGLCSAESAHASWESGEQVVEYRPVELNADGSVVLPPDVGVVTSLVIRYDVLIEVGDMLVTVPSAAEWRFAALLAPPEEGLAVDDSSVSFCVETDAWLPSTGAEQSNEPVARANAPRLAAALRRWEQLTGKPIVDFVSNAYADAVARYGFTT